MSRLFPGFGPPAFEALERLRAEPHIARYRQEKATIASFIQAPFAAYRDDLAVEWVIPSRIPLETERNVFSRILKNDFGAGGAHHHYWLAFYPQGGRRLESLQLVHSLQPDRFDLGLYVPERAGPAFIAARARLIAEPGRALDVLRPLIDRGYAVTFGLGGGRVVSLESDAETLPAETALCSEMWIGRSLPRAEVEAMGPALVDRGVESMRDLQPLYLLLTGA
jgi:hypothetical protein